MKKLVLKTVMGMTTGFATMSQAQSYLSQKPLTFSNSTTQVSTPRNLKKNSDEKEMSLSLSLSARSSRIQDDNVKATTSSSRVGVTWDWTLTSWLKTKLDADYGFSTGYSAQFYGTEGTPGSGAGITEGSFTLVPSSHFNFSFGIVETQFNPILSAYGGDSLAGARQVTTFSLGPIKTTLNTYQAVPTQLSNSNRILDDKNESVLTLGNLNFVYGEAKDFLKLSYTKFDFYNMTQASAEDSKYLGNTMIGNDGNYSLFKYKFRGQELALGASQSFLRHHQILLSASAIRNDQAIKFRNEGWLARGAIQMDFSRFTLRPSLTRFRLEPDVLPSLYSIGSFGYTNRDGLSTELRGIYKEKSIEAFLRYLDSKEIESRTSQADRISYSIGLEVTYEIL